MTPEILLQYVGEQPRGPFPPEHRSGGVYYVWSLSYNGEAWSEVKANREFSEREVMTHASIRVAMQTNYQVLEWRRVTRADQIASALTTNVDGVG